MRKLTAKDKTVNTGAHNQTRPPTRPVRGSRRSKPEPVSKVRPRQGALLTADQEQDECEQLGGGENRVGALARHAGGVGCSRRMSRRGGPFAPAAGRIRSRPVVALRADSLRHLSTSPTTRTVNNTDCVPCAAIPRSELR
jgi:hypothetical protein